MLKIVTCRRTFIATLAIVGLLILGLAKDMDVALSIMGVVGAIGGSNAYEKAMKAKHANGNTQA